MHVETDENYMYKACQICHRFHIVETLEDGEILSEWVDFAPAYEALQLQNQITHGYCLTHLEKVLDEETFREFLQTRPRSEVKQYIKEKQSMSISG